MLVDRHPECKCFADDLECKKVNLKKSAFLETCHASGMSFEFTNLFTFLMVRLNMIDIKY